MVDTSSLLFADVGLDPSLDSFLSSSAVADTASLLFADVGLDPSLEIAELGLDSFS